MILAAVLLPAATLTVATGTAAQASPAIADAAPAVGTDQNGNEYAFWENGNQGLETATYTTANGWGVPHAVTVNGNGMGPLGSEPTVAVNYTTGDQYVFWKGTGATPQLWEAYNNSNGWHGPNEVKNANGGEMGPVGTRPSADMSSNGHEFVYWKNTNDNLEFTWWNGNNFQGPYAVQVGDDSSQKIGPMGSVPSAALEDSTADDYSMVVWESTGTSQQLEFTTLNADTTAVPVEVANFPGSEALHINGSNNDVGLGPLGSQPAVAMKPCITGCGHQVIAGWRNTNNDLEYASYLGGADPGLWTGPQAAGVGPLGSAPSITWGTTVKAFWKGTNSHLWWSQYNQSSDTWSNPTDAGFGLN